MRTTVRIDDDLLRELKDRAHQENVSVAQLVNRVIRRGLKTATGRRNPFRQKTCALGKPLIDMNKALAFATQLDDERTLQKMAQGK